MENLKLRPVLAIRVFAGDTKAFGPGIAMLLRHVDALHSLRKAAAEMGMAYSKAWRITKESEAALGFALLDSSTGGKHGGGAHLTPEPCSPAMTLIQTRSAPQTCRFFGSISRRTAFDLLQLDFLRNDLRRFGNHHLPAECDANRIPRRERGHSFAGNINFFPLRKALAFLRTGNHYGVFIHLSHRAGKRLPAALASAKQCGEQECRYENDPPFFHKKEYLRPSL